MSTLRCAVLVFVAGTTARLYGQPLESPTSGPVAPTTAPAQAEENGQAQAIVKSKRQARLLLDGVWLYANDHKGLLPTSLEQVIEYFPDQKDILRNPRQPERENGYVWVKPAPKFSQVRDAGHVLVLYEAYDKWPEDALVIGFMDRHIEVIKDEKTFKQKLHPPGPVAVRDVIGDLVTARSIMYGGSTRLAASVSLRSPRARLLVPRPSA